MSTSLTAKKPGNSTRESSVPHSRTPSRRENDRRIADVRTVERAAERQPVGSTIPNLAPNLQTLANANHNPKKKREKERSISKIHVGIICNGCGKKDFVIQFYLKEKYVFRKEMIFMDIKAHLSKKEN